MNDMSPADDELLSSYLDGEATPEGIARIESDPALSARVEELRAARDLIATPVTPLSPPDVDSLIGAALAASATSPVVTGIARARTRRSDRVRTMVAVAAGVLLLAVAVPVLNSIGSGSSDDDTASVEMDSGDDDTTDDSFTLEAAPAADPAAGADRDESADDTVGDDDAADAADMADAPDEDADDTSGATTTTSGGRTGLDALEPVLDEAELRNAVSARLFEYDAEAAVEDTSAADFTPPACAEEFAFLDETEELTLVDSGVTAVGGTATAVVLVWQADPPGYLLYSAPLQTCTPIAILELGD